MINFRFYPQYHRLNQLESIPFRRKPNTQALLARIAASNMLSCATEIILATTFWVPRRPRLYSSLTIHCLIQPKNACKDCLYIMPLNNDLLKALYTCSASSFSRCKSFMCYWSRPHAWVKRRALAMHASTYDGNVSTEMHLFWVLETIDKLLLNKYMFWKYDYV